MVLFGVLDNLGSWHFGLTLFTAYVTNCLNLKAHWDFPGGPVVRNLPSNAGNLGLIPGRGTKIPHATGQLSPHALEPARTRTRETPVCCNEDPACQN